MWKDKLKFKVGQTVQIVRDNHVWNGSVAKVVRITEDARFPYELLFLSSNRPMTAGEKFVWDEVSLDAYNPKHDKLVQTIESRFPGRKDVYFSTLTGGAVVLTAKGKLVRILPDGEIDE